ncbi:MAG: hypothetical protein JSU66_11650 [Deltaproteobacteria bacterium]|nr:MAG: hypothetical protein JSU66_11650 [Deltaproteobacteria bacterium]
MKGRNPESKAQALRVLDDFMAAFNARDGEAFTATLNYHYEAIYIATRVDGHCGVHARSSSAP